MTGATDRVQTRATARVFPSSARRRGRHQAERVLNAEVPYARYLIRMDREGV